MILPLYRREIAIVAELTLSQDSQEKSYPSNLSIFLGKNLTKFV